MYIGCKLHMAHKLIFSRWIPNLLRGVHIWKAAVRVISCNELFSRTCPSHRCMSFNLVDSNSMNSLTVLASLVPPTYVVDRFTVRPCKVPIGRPDMNILCRLNCSDTLIILLCGIPSMPRMWHCHQAPNCCLGTRLLSKERGRNNYRIEHMPVLYWWSSKYLTLLVKW